jgi:hypothetical protein
MRHVDDSSGSVPPSWMEHGGVMLPMFQSEALWIHFQPHYDGDRETAYPFAIKIAAGKINAVTGQQWTNNLHHQPQDYVVAPPQPWLDGFCISAGVIRQFVATPLGQGYTAEEQISDNAEFGGVQIIVCPMRREVFERRFPKREHTYFREMSADMMSANSVRSPSSSYAAMGLGAGGRMKQVIHDDPHDFNDWDSAQATRCFVHIANSESWQRITGEAVPTRPCTAADYARAGLPWFEIYEERAQGVSGTTILDGVKSIATLWGQKHHSPLTDNDSVVPANVVDLRRGLTKNQVREGNF